jgi:hypothetical protein
VTGIAFGNEPKIISGRVQPQLHFCNPMVLRLYFRNHKINNGNWGTAFQFPVFILHPPSINQIAALFSERGKATISTWFGIMNCLDANCFSRNVPIQNLFDSQGYE